MGDAALAVVLVLLLAVGAGALRGVLAGGGAPASITVLAPLAEAARLLRARAPRPGRRLLLGGGAVLLAAAAQTAVLAGAPVWWLGATALLRWVGAAALGARRPLRSGLVAEALLVLAVAGPVVAAGSWGPATIVAVQQDLRFAVAMPVAAVAFLLAAGATRAPLGRAVAEASGGGRLLLLAGRSLLLASAAALAVPLYLGAAFPGSWAWAALLLAVVVLVGRRFPSVDVDLLPRRWTAAILVLAALQLALTVLLTLAAR